MKKKMTEKVLRDLFQEQIDRIDSKMEDLQDILYDLDSIKDGLRDTLGRIIYENFEENENV